MNINLTEEQVTNVKRVIFGNQKQANVTNEAVVKIIASGIASVKHSSVLNSEIEFVDACEEYLNDCVKGRTPDDTLVMLLAGEQSLANVKADGPRVVKVSQPNPESPKYIFRVCMLGEDADVDMSATEGEIETSSISLSSSKVSTDCPYERDDDLATRARKIKDAILPLCPDTVKKEIPNDEYAQALCYAEYYYKNIAK